MCIPLWLLVAAYALHIIEEYRGGWLDWAQDMSGLPMSRAEFLIANGLVIALGILCSFISYAEPLVSLTFPGLALMNAVFAHIGTTVVKKVKSPGVLSSVFLFIPLGVWAYGDFYSKGLIPTWGILLTLVFGLLIMAVPLVFQILKSKIMRKT